MKAHAEPRLERASIGYFSANIMAMLSLRAVTIAAGMCIGGCIARMHKYMLWQRYSAFVDWTLYLASRIVPVPGMSPRSRRACFNACPCLPRLMLSSASSCFCSPHDEIHGIDPLMTFVPVVLMEAKAAV